MSKVTSTFKQLYNLTKEAAHAVKEPFVKSKNMRAVDSAIDSAELQGIEAQEALDKELETVKDGKTIDLTKILAYRQTISNAENTVKELKTFKEEFFSTSEPA